MSLVSINYQNTSLAVIVVEKKNKCGQKPALAKRNNEAEEENIAGGRSSSSRGIKRCRSSLDDDHRQNRQQVCEKSLCLVLTDTYAIGWDAKLGRQRRLPGEKLLQKLQRRALRRMRQEIETRAWACRRLGVSGNHSVVVVGIEAPWGDVCLSWLVRVRTRWSIS